MSTEKKFQNVAVDTVEYTKCALIRFVYGVVTGGEIKRYAPSKSLEKKNKLRFIRNSIRLCIHTVKFKQYKYLLRQL